MPKSDLRIDIFGTDFSISTDEAPEYLDKLLNKYRQNLENVKQRTGLTDPLKIAILTGFLLCDDLEKAGATKFEREKKDEEEVERLTLGIIARLDGIVRSSGFSSTDSLKAEKNDSTVVGKPPEVKPYVKEEAAAEAPQVNSSIFRLKNTIKNYAWGSAEWIPALLGQRNISRIPWAELWMGVNPMGPSRITDEDGEIGILLSELIEKEKGTFLGRETAQNYGSLPFLFKVIAAAKPLSIQAHPDQDQARDGFERENRKGIPLDAPNRNYRDSNQKTEMICALNEFTALCGFREVDEICFLIEILSQNSEGVLKAGFEELVSALKQEEENPYKAIISALFRLESEARQKLNSFIRERQAHLERDFPEYSNEWAFCVYLSNFFPGDPGIIAPLYLNIIELAPGEAMYLPAGTLHSYIHGLGIELMTDSDNVLRGGLSSKHTDPEELLKILHFSAYKPKILKPPRPAPALFNYPAPVKEFSLSVMRGAGAAIPYLEKGPSIVIVTGGSAAVTGSENQPEGLNPGESIFIPPEKNLVFSGTFTAYAASVKVTG